MSKSPAYWLLKSDPDVFGFEDLVKAPKRTTSWEGVRNYQARNLMRDNMKVGDRAFIYHSQLAEPCILGIATIVRTAYPDTTALQRGHRYFDEKAASKGETPWVMVDVQATHRFIEPITRTQLKAEKKLQKMVLLQKGSRLSVQPVTAIEFDHICALAKSKPL